MFLKIKKNNNKTNIYLFGMPIFYRKVEDGIQTTRFLCFRSKTIKPEAFIEEQKCINEGQSKAAESKKTNNKKLSIVIPMFNTSKYVERCIKSIQSQSYKDIEIIVVDDASTDGSADIVKNIQQQDPRIILLRNTENSGSGISRNKGISIATGSYITFIDSDDYIAYKHFFADCLRSMKKEKSECLITPFIREKNNELKNDKFEYNGIVSGKEACSLYLSRKFGTHASCGKFFKTELVKKQKFNEYGFSQDVPFVAETLISAKKVQLFKKYGYVYFNDNNSAWRPVKLTELHFYSSFRLFFDILNFQKRLLNSGIYINTVAFNRIWQKEHGSRINNFICNNSVSSNAFIKEIVDIVKTIQPALPENILPNDLFGLSNLNFANNIALKSAQELAFVRNLKMQTQVFERLQKKESVVIYISHLSNGGLERVASELSYILHDLGFAVHFLLDRMSNIDYAYCGDVHRANIQDEDVVAIIKDASFIFDFKFKSLQGEFPIVKYVIENYPEKYIATIHNTKTCKNYFEKTYEYLNGNPITKIKNVLCVSEAVKREFTKIYGESVNVNTLHNFVDHYKNLANSLDSFDCPANDYFLFAARLDQTEHKGVDILIQAFDKAKVPDNVKLILCGSGKIEKEVQKILDRSEKRNNVIILPFEKNVFPLMRNAKALLAPSRWEGFSMVHLEALSVGTPVVSTLCGGAAEIIQPGINGFLSPVENIDEFANNIEKIWSSSFRRDDVLKTVLNFTREQYKLKLNQILEGD